MANRFAPFMLSYHHGRPVFEQHARVVIDRPANHAAYDPVPGARHRLGVPDGHEIEFAHAIGRGELDRQGHSWFELPIDDQADALLGDVADGGSPARLLGGALDLAWLIDASRKAG